MPHLTSMRLASIMSQTFGLGDKGKSRFHRTFRNFVTKGIVDSTLDEHDGRGTLLLDLENAAVAVLLQPIADMAVDARGLRDVSARLRGPDTLKGGAGIVRLLEAARDDREATLLVSVHWHAGTGEIERAIRIEIEGEELTGEAAEILSDYRKGMIVDLATVKVPTTHLLVPLLVAVQ